jgi:NADH-quinone oxidoreductase subunit J
VANLIFYVMAVGAVLFGAGVVLLRTPIASVISLLGSFFCLATIYLVAGFPLLAAVQILVYAGAVLVLFLFVIMLLNLADATDLPRIDRGLLGQRRVGLTAAISLALLGASLFAINATEIAAADPALAEAALDAPGGAGGLAEALFTQYLLPFEATSLLLLATAVAVMVLAKRQRPGSQATGRNVAAARAPVQGGGDRAGTPEPNAPQPAEDNEPPAPRQEAVREDAPARNPVPAGGSK